MMNIPISAIEQCFNEGYGSQTSVPFKFASSIAKDEAIAFYEWFEQQPQNGKSMSQMYDKFRRESKKQLS